MEYHILRDPVAGCGQRNRQSWDWRKLTTMQVETSSPILSRTEIFCGHREGDEARDLGTKLALPHCPYVLEDDAKSRPVKCVERRSRFSENL